MPTDVHGLEPSPPWLKWEQEHRSRSTSKLSEVQQWLSRLPFRMQGTVFAAIRGGDLVSKPLSVTEVDCWHGYRTEEELIQCPYSHTNDAPERQLTQWLRWLCLRPADPREVDHPGAYMQSRPPSPESWKPSMLGAHPMHWYMHLAHAYEVVGYEYPLGLRSDNGDWLKSEAYRVYHRLVTSLHLVPETREGLWERMTEDRIATGEIVS